MMMNWNSGWGSGGWLLMIPMMLVFWGLIAWVVVVLVRRPSAPAAVDAVGARSAAQILDERLARGEIDEAEYRARRAVLRDGG